ncbi:DUF4865 family protein [Archangium violaceum]|uniref:DUF4865 family protein n=1 Tax=Archangium violaceum TaxID=83451 RepID=UPI002B324145|nr:DUF4865 family protein [Archangium violaceum]
MIAMQYSFVLPADYDMSIIGRRIAEKGHLMDGFPGLVFKAYLSAQKAVQQPSDSENLYAPFYLWKSPAGMNDFLCGPGFVSLTQSFGWPSVKTWSVWHAEVSPRITHARFATRESGSIPPYAALDALRASETGRAKDCVHEDGALAALVGFEPTTWTLVRFQLWAERPSSGRFEDRHIYSVGHVSTT